MPVLCVFVCVHVCECVFVCVCVCVFVCVRIGLPIWLVDCKRWLFFVVDVCQLSLKGWQVWLWRMCFVRLRCFTPWQKLLAEPHRLSPCLWKWFPRHPCAFTSNAAVKSTCITSFPVKSILIGESVLWTYVLGLMYQWSWLDHSSLFYVESTQLGRIYLDADIIAICIYISFSISNW